MRFSMKRQRFADVPLVYKIGAAPVFAMVILFAVVASAALVQERQTLVMRDILSNGALQSALIADSEKITAGNGPFFRLMAKQPAGSSTLASRKAVTQRLAALDAIKADLLRLRPELPAAQRRGLDTTLTELVIFRAAMQTAGAMPGVNFLTAANFFPPYEANYLRMTASLQEVSAQLAASAAVQAGKNARQTAMIRKLMFAFAGATLVLVTAVEWLILNALRRTMTEISEATESLAAGDNDLDLERLARDDEFGPIVRSLTVFRENQLRMIAMRQQQEAMQNTARMHQARLVRMISVLSETNEAILRAETREKLFDLVCKAAASGGNFLFTIVLLAEKDEILMSRRPCE